MEGEGNPGVWGPTKRQTRAKAGGAKLRRFEGDLMRAELPNRTSRQPTLEACPRAQLGNGMGLSAGRSAEAPG